VDTQEWQAHKHHFRRVCTIFPACGRAYLNVTVHKASKLHHHKAECRVYVWNDGRWQLIPRYQPSKGNEPCNDGVIMVNSQVKEVTK